MSDQQKNDLHEEEEEVERLPFKEMMESFTGTVLAFRNVSPGAIGLLGMATGLFESLAKTMLQKVAFETLNENDEVVSRRDDVPDDQLGYEIPDGDKKYLVSAADIREVEKIEKTRVHLTTFSTLLPRTLLVSLVSQYDALLGKVIGHMYTIHPDLLKASERQMSLSQLVEMGSVEDAIRHMIEKEVDSVLRKSHSEQLSWLSSKLGIPMELKKDLKRQFIELTQRRHLFVHTDGKVTTQYLRCCGEAGLQREEMPNVGDSLDIDMEYFSRAHDCILEVGVKLVQVVWRKLAPKESETADWAMINLTYELLVQGENELALVLLRFAVDEIPRKKNEDSEVGLYLLVNLAQAYKWTGDEKRMKEVLSRVRWAGTADKYLLAKAVLQEDYQTAFSIMERIGDQGDIDDDDYESWPLFQQFRKQTGYPAVYKKVFGRLPTKCTELSTTDWTEIGNLIAKNMASSISEEMQSVE